MTLNEPSRPAEPLTGWRRVVQGNADRPTRFHTARGELMPPSAWLELPGSILSRLRRTPPPEPWIVPSAARWLASEIRPDWRVLELGSGSSTAWLARHAGEVLSLEDVPDWYREVDRQLTEAGVRNCDLQLVELDRFPEFARSLSPESFDLVVVDCNENERVGRMDCAAAGCDLVKAGRYLLLDDSDWKEFRRQREVLSGWPVRRFVGTKRFPLQAVETSIYRRPSAPS